MNIFKALGNELTYKEVLQLDGAFSVAQVGMLSILDFQNIKQTHILQAIAWI